MKEYWWYLKEHFTKQVDNHQKCLDHEKQGESEKLLHTENFKEMIL